MQVVTLSASSIVSMNEIQSVAKAMGSPFFDKRLMAIENTRVFHEAIKVGSKYYFVTANRFPWEQKDGYTIRVMGENGNIRVIGEVAQYTTYSKAMARLSNTPGK